jgi:imidazolonepropionase-like amidohydrolase
MKHTLLLAAASALALTAAAFAQTPTAAPTKPVTASSLPATTGTTNPSLQPVISVKLQPGVQATLIQHAHVYTVGAQGTLTNADVLIAGGKIVAVGPSIAPPLGAKIIDAHGKPVTPGLMASWTTLGIQEIQLVSETSDVSPNQTLDSAAYDTADAINPASTLIPVARIAGVTRSLTAPADCGDVFCGVATVIHLGNGPDLVVRKQAGVLVELEPVGGAHQANSRPDIWVKFRETLDDAREYLAQRGGYHRPGGARDQRTNKVDLDALAPVIQGKEPLIVHVERASTIRQVLAYTQANKIKLIVAGGGEGWQVAKELAAAHVPVVLDNDNNLPNSFSDLGATLKGAARLDAAGVTVVFQPQNDNPGHYARTLSQIAGNAVANGMPWDHALAAITKNPAQVWGIDASYGTLEPGKDADVVIWDGDPLNLAAPTAVFIKGDNIPLVSRQTKLRDRYRDLGNKNPPFYYR